MASSLMGSWKAFFFSSFFFLCLHSLSVLCAEFEVGGDKGRVVPNAKNEQLFNDWASQNRFKVGFEYKKDSVLVVTNEDYEKCRSIHPIFFSNNGNTVLKLDRPGLFYFISGSSEHCERGLKMIIKVLEIESPNPSQNSTSNSTHKSGEVEIAKNNIYFPTIMVVMIISFLGALIG